VSCTKVIVLVALLGLTVSRSNLQAAVVNIDGNLSSDWGISLDNNKHLVFSSAYTNSNGTQYVGNQNLALECHGTTTLSNGRLVVYDLEDTNDSWDHSHKVGPLYGGQDYDAEALVVGVSNGNLYIAIATGQRPDNGYSYFGPGDICITKGSEVWGIETGGGSHATSSHMVVDGDQGTNYTLNSNGYTTSSMNSSSRLAGSIWKGGTWDAGINGSNDTRTQLRTGGTYLGMSDYVYNFDSAFGQHAFIELCIPNYADLFGSNLAGASIRWSPVCGNDQLTLCVVLPSELPPGPSVPEPASVTIWAMLLLTAICFARRKCSLARRP
jgi:hypothetical protein